MPTPNDKKLYNLRQKQTLNIRRPQHINQVILGGTYSDDNKPKELKRWFKEKWQDIGNLSYPVYRPTVRINSKSPLLPSEINKKKLKEQIQLKQIFKGEKKLPKFKKK